MKKIVTLILLCISMSPIVSYGQMPYYDALALRDLKPVLTDSGYLVFPLAISQRASEILKTYVDKGENYNDIEQAFSKNPFIRLPVNAESSDERLAGLAKGFVSH